LDDPDKFEQCVNEGFSKLMQEQSHEGCNIEGYLKVNKVQGIFYFAPGPSFEIQGMQAHDLNEYRKHSKDWSFSHQIHHLSFGESSGFTNPLDGIGKSAVGLYDAFQYYIKVVSTEFSFLNGTKLITNQFASTEHQRDVSPKFGDMPTSMPGIDF
jgi:endoplasmic reticulum-Golgi intermediate compartment protein 3